MKPELIVVGGGLAGSEAAWQAAERGVKVVLYEMRPHLNTGAHVTAHLGELVCSNSLGSKLIDRASGLLQEELRRLKSLLISCADETAIPAGSALAVDREKFARLVTSRVVSHPNIRINREEMKSIPSAPTIIASGPLTSESLSHSIKEISGSDNIYFYDAISPILEVDSINFSKAFRANRYDRGTKEEGDYINCPFTEKEYYNFVSELINAQRIELKEFEAELEIGVKAGAHKYFEGCLPVEIIARRGIDSLAYGPMRPVGLKDPRTGIRPFAVVQLRQDNFAGSLYNMVGFQTNLTFSEQRRIFRLIPGLEIAKFARYGQMHRNTFIFSPLLLKPTLQFKARAHLLFAGQITGIEGYAGNIATGWLAGVNAARLLHSNPLLVMPKTTMMGALCSYITQAKAADFQPMKANFGILPALNTARKTTKRERASMYAQRALGILEDYINLED